MFKFSICDGIFVKAEAAAQEPGNVVLSFHGIIYIVESAAGSSNISVCTDTFIGGHRRTGKDFPYESAGVAPRVLIHFHEFRFS